MKLPRISCLALVMSAVLALSGLPEMSSVSYARDVVYDASKPLTEQISALPMRGSKNADVTIIEVTDYECPFCSRVQFTIDRILKDYPRTVRHAVIHHPLGFHKNAKSAAKAAVAADKQGKFWEMHEALFAAAKERKLNDDFYAAEAGRLGLDVKRFRADMMSTETDRFIEKGLKDAAAAGLTGTPTFLINGVKVVGAQPRETFKEAIEAEIDRAKRVKKKKHLKGEALYRELFKTASNPVKKTVEKTPEPDKIGDEKVRKLIPLGTSPVIGSYEAPVTMVAFFDFQCPFSAKSVSTTKKLLQNNPGKIRLVFKHFPLSFHDDAKLAHQASEAAKLQGKFWEYYDKLIENHKALKRNDLIKYAAELNLDVDRFKNDLDSKAVIRAVESDIHDGAANDVSGTPNFYLNGTLVMGAQPLSVFQDVLDRELKIARLPKYKELKGSALQEQIIKDSIHEQLPIAVNTKGAPVRGDIAAPVSIIVFSDFECPFCGRVNATLDALLKEYDGKIKLIFKNFPLGFHHHAQHAAEASLYARDYGKFWEMHDIMFAAGSELDMEFFKNAAQKIGLDPDGLEQALTNGQYRDEVKADMEDAAKAGVSGTPSFLINGVKFVGAQPIDKFRTQIDRALKDVKSAESKHRK